MTLPLTQQSAGVIKINATSTVVTTTASVGYADDIDELLHEVVRLPSPEAAATPDLADYAIRTQKYYRAPHVELLGHLSDEFGLSWTAVASVVHVSIPAIRKWRTGGDITDGNRLALAKLVALCDQLQAVGVEWPAAWLDRRVWSSVPVRLLDVAAADRMDLLLSHASGDLDGVDVLDAFSPDWRERFAAERTEVLFDQDGRPTLHVGADSGS